MIRTAAARSTSWSCDRSCVTPKVRAAFKMSGDGKDQLTEEEIDAFAAEMDVMATGRSRTTNLSRR